MEPGGVDDSSQQGAEEEDEDDEPGVKVGPRGVREINELMKEEARHPLARRAEKGVHFANHARLEVQVPKSYKEAMEGPQAEQWGEAIKAEMASLLQHGTWELTKLPHGRKAVGCKWVFALKRDKAGNITRFKARLVAQGFSQVEGWDYNETYSPVARFVSLRVFLSIAAQRGLRVDQIDVKTAFLHGVLREDIYMLQPEGYVQTEGGPFVCHLIKTLYGLKQSSRAWNERLTAELRKLGFVPLECEASLFRHLEDPDRFLLVYVDDLLLAGGEATREWLKEGLKQHFEITEPGEATWFLGFAITRDWERRTMELTQKQYAKDVLAKFDMEECTPARTPLPTGYRFNEGKDSPAFSTQKYQSAVGSLMYLVTGSRPDLGFVVGAASRFLTCPTEHHWKGIQHIFRYLKGTLHYSLTVGGEGELALQGYSDADWGANDDCRRSISGYAFQYGKGIISWSSKRQASPAVSSAEAEYMALARATKEAIWLQTLLGELHGVTCGTVPIYVDNSSCIALAKNPESHERTKHIDIQYHLIRHHVAHQRIEVIHCPTAYMWADFLTKSLPKIKLEACLTGLGVNTKGELEGGEATSIASNKGEIVGNLRAKARKDPGAPEGPKQVPQGLSTFRPGGAPVRPGGA